MKYWTHTTPSLFSPTECLQIRAHALKLSAKVATVGHGGRSIVDTSIRKSTVRWLNPGQSEFIDLNAKISQALLTANARNFGFDISGNLGYQFTEYALDEGYDWHTDNNYFTSEPFDRKLSLVIPLSHPDEYNGGQLLFDLKSQPDTPGMGDMIVFPSFLRHKVEPVTSGQRFSLVTWFVGPQFR